MSFQNISSIPIQDFSDIASNINIFQDNNIRLQKQKERQEFENRLQSRQQDLQSDISKSMSSKDDVINKLRKTLSKRYELSLNDYIILVDKFKLNNTNLKRDTIISLIKYLNSTKSYTSNTESVEINSNAIKATKIDPIDNEDFERNLKLMEEERNQYIQNVLMNTEPTKAQKNTIENKTPIPTIIQPSFEPNVSISDENNIELSITEKVPAPIENLIEKNLDNASSLNSSNSNIKEELLMINLLKNEINGNFIININFNGKDKIQNIKKVEFVACLMGKNLVDKNSQLKNHSIIFKIDEFDNNIYINGSETTGFCQCFLEKNNNYYSYTNKDKIFGIYVPSSDNNSLEKLHISIFDNLGVNINNLKYTENDQLSLVLKFFVEE